MSFNKRHITPNCFAHNDKAKISEYIISRISDSKLNDYARKEASKQLILKIIIHIQNDNSVISFLDDSNVVEYITTVVTPQKHIAKDDKYIFWIKLKLIKQGNSIKIELLETKNNNTINNHIRSMLPD